MNGSLVIGKGTGAPRGALMRLVMQLALHAKQKGMALVAIRRSKQKGSLSCYLALNDRLARLWIVRVSDHRRPLVSPFPKPHFDLVTHDGVSGLSQARGTIECMADGSMPWHDAEVDVRMPRPKKARR